MCQPHQGPRSCITRNAASGKNRNEDDCVHDVSQRTQPSVSVCDHEGTGVSPRATEKVLIIWRDSYGDHQGSKDVKQRQAQPNASDSLWDRLPWVSSLCSNKTGVLRARHGKDTCRKYTEESLESMSKGRRVPVSESYGSFVWSATSGDDNQGNDDDEDPTELDRGRNDLYLTEELYSDNVDENDHYPEDRDPGSCRNSIGPE